MTNAKFIGWDCHLGEVLQIGRQQWFLKIPDILNISLHKARRSQGHMEE